MTMRTFALALVLVSSACGVPQVSLEAGPRTFTSTDYETIYDRWTRSQDDFAWSRMTDILHATATFESWEFRWAYVVRYAHDYSIDTSAREEMLRATLADAQAQHRFFVTLAGERIRETQLTGRRSAWRVILVDDDGHQTEPIGIEFVRRPTAVEEVYFPSVHPQRNTFRIVFPATRLDGTPSIPPDARTVRLRFTGARGQVDLVWTLEDGGAPPRPEPPAPAPVTTTDPAATATDSTVAPTPPDEAPPIVP